VIVVVPYVVVVVVIAVLDTYLNPIIFSFSCCLITGPHRHETCGRDGITSTQKGEETRRRRRRRCEGEEEGVIIVVSSLTQML